MTPITHMTHKREPQSNSLSVENIVKKRAVFSAMVFTHIVAVALSVVIAVSIGQVSIPFRQSFWILVDHMSGMQIDSIDGSTNGMFTDVIWQIRFPRVLVAMVVGAGLALCGTVMQASVQNPLADPFILGISSGASLGATFSIMVGFGIGGILGEFGVATWAFLGALIAAVLVLGLASIGGKTSSVKLILAGTVINALCGAFSNFIIYFAKNAEGIRSVTFWTARVISKDMGVGVLAALHDLSLASDIVIFFTS
ncbi:iron ABC transporter permease [Paenibacillus sp. MER 180]|uniref:FecCD family ABC transporter permease n=1 Tax=Paenibacillus sp. MER 180 TaxID=2939570 RepID=UPI00203E5E14|nr:iron ABC transporter permease [Paenibacillus sp. MER 180]MCM3291419.1 iron ABC transporter permease [Paenibacillus sp. MER 180]